VKAFETKVYRKDGSILWLSINSRLISNDLGNPTYIDGFVSDITENRKLRDELSAVMREQRIILDTANVGISLIRDRKQVWINRKTEEMFQYSKEELINQTTRKLYPSQEAYEQLGADAYPILAQGMTYETVQELVRRDGSHIWVRYNGRAIDPPDLSQGTLWILEDITERRGIEEKLQRAYDELELRVADRTEALMLVNEELRTEIAERNQAEEALTKSEAKYSSYVKNAPDGVFIADEKGRYIEVNNAACLMTGFTEEELLQMSIPDLLSEESLEAGHAHFKTLTETGVSKGELQFKHKDGSKRWWFVDAVKLSEARFLGFTKDITERKRAEMRLQQITERFNVALYASKAGAWDWDIITGQVEWSSQMFDIFGLDPLRNKASFDTWERALHPQDVEIAGIRIDQALKQQAILNNDYRVLLPDGQICWINAVGQGEYNEQGNPIRMTGICMDITERKQVEDALRESESKLRAVLDATPFPIALVDVQDNIVDFWSQSAISLFGHTAPTAAKWYEIAYPDPNYRREVVERWKPFLEIARESHQAVNTGEYLVTCSDGSVRVCELYTAFSADRLIVTFNDITERKRSEEALRHTEQRLRLANRATNDVIWDWDIITDLQQWNESGTIVFGWTEIVEHPVNADWWVQRVHSDDRQRIHDTFFGVVNNPLSDAWSDEYRFLKTDGSYADVLDRGYVLRDEQGKATRMVGAMLDITERKRAEEGLREKEAAMRAILDATTEALSVIDVEGTLLMINTTFASRFNKTSEDLIGTSIYDLIAPELAKTRREQVNLVLRSSKPIQFEDQRGDRFVEHSLYPIFDGVGNVNKIAIYSRDITERKRAEEQHRFLSAITANMSDSIVATDAGFAITYMNMKAQELFGYSMEELIGKKLDIFNAEPMDEKIQRELYESVSSGGTYLGEFLNRRKDGSTFICEYKVTPLIGENGAPYAYVGMQQNITERKRAEAELSESRRRLADIIEFLPDATLAINLEGRIIIWNRAIEEMTGIPATEMIGKGDYAYTIPFYGEARHQLMDLVFEDKESIARLYPQITREGDTIVAEAFCNALYNNRGAWIVAKASPLHDHSGRIIGAIESIRDITDRKQAEQALIESEERYRGIIENVIDVYYRSDKKGNIIMMSPSALSVLGYGDLSELNGKNLAGDIYMVPEDREIFLSELNRKGEVHDFEVILKRKNGTPVPVSTSSRYYYDKDGSILGVEGFFRDISERKRVEQEIKDRQDMEKSILASVPHGVFGVEHRKIFFANDTMEAIFGWKPEEVVGKSTRVLFRNEEEWKEYGSNLYSMMAKETSTTFEPDIPFVRKDGREIFCRNSISIFGDDLTEGNKIVATFEDITERKQIESQRDQQLNFTKALNEIAETIISKDNSEDILESTNRIVGETLQLDRALIYDVSFEKKCITGLCEWLGQDHPDIAPTKNEYPLDMFLTPFAEIKKTKKYLVSHSNEVNEHFTEDGSGKILHEQMNIKTLIWYPFAFDEHGYYVFTLNQILKHRQWTKEEISFLESAAKQISIGLIKIRILKEKEHLVATLQESEELFRVSMEKAPEGVYMNDLDGNFLYGNRKAEEIIGYRREELIGRNFLDFNMIAEDSLSKASELLKASIEGRSTGPDDLEMIRKDGRRIVIEITTNVIQREGQANVLAFVRDITERRQIEEETQLLEERLQRAEKMESLGLLAGGVAHDLNNVLGIVVGYSEMLVDEMDKSNPIREDLKKILEGGNRSAAIVQDLLTLARRGVQTKKSVNINAIIKDCHKTPDFEKVFAYNQHVRLKMDLESDLLNIMGSPVHLGKTLINLVSNAVEAMHDGGILTISTTNQYMDMPIHGYDNVREGDYVVLTVSDTGEGILERDIKRIFEPFYTKKIMGRSGTGLGLAVVWGTIKDHNGYINVESTEGKGTTFTLYFPVTREEIASDQISVSMSEYMGKGETILVVDDINRQRELASRMLTKLNYSVSAVASGEEAVEYLKTNKADLIVLDMIMDPGIDGLETYENILKLNPVQKAVIVSGFSESDRVREAQNLGAGTYVPKPYVLERLGMAVRKELDRK